MGFFDIEEKVERDWWTGKIKSVGGKKVTTDWEGKVTTIGGEKVIRNLADKPIYVGKEKVRKDFEGKTFIGKKKIGGDLD